MRCCPDGGHFQFGCAVYRHAKATLLVDTDSYSLHNDLVSTLKLKKLFLHLAFPRLGFESAWSFNTSQALWIWKDFGKRICTFGSNCSSLPEIIAIIQSQRSRSHTRHLHLELAARVARTNCRIGSALCERDAENIRYNDRCNLLTKAEPCTGTWKRLLCVSLVPPAPPMSG
jgi:hypothetical protein